MDNTKQHAMFLTDMLATYMDEKGMMKEGADLTSFFTGLLLATGIIFHETTGQNADLVETINVLNRLAFQYVNKTQDEPNEPAN